ncbi:hypothetical protein ABH991_004080 [Bradyrhizobium ottawaense]
MIVPEKVSSTRVPDVILPRRKISEPPAAGDLAGAFDQLALACRVEKFTGKIGRHRPAVQDMGGDRKQGVVGKGHVAAAVDVPGAVEVLFLDPEGAADVAIRLDPVPEGADMGLKTVANPGPPAHKFALGGDVEVRAAG